MFGVMQEQNKEVLLRTAIYYRLPAANLAFHLLQEVFSGEERREKCFPPVSRRKLTRRRAGSEGM
jgi:hypothetical protein